MHSIHFRASSERLYYPRHVEVANFNYIYNLGILTQSDLVQLLATALHSNYSS